MGTTARATTVPVPSMDPSKRCVLLCSGLLCLLAWGCAGAGGPRPGPDEVGDDLSRAIRALAAGDYGDAAARLRRVAGRCESGADGRRAAFLLATSALDPRNPDASPDHGAALAAHFLGLPGGEPRERVAAETLYLLALDQGAQPVGSAEDSAGAGADRGVAARFDRCGDEADPVGAVDRPLPALPDTARLYRLRAERDSLRVRVRELEAEVERIRALLREGPPPESAGVHP